MKLPEEINQHFEQLHQKFPQSSAGLTLPDLLAIAALTSGGIIAGMFWQQPWLSPNLLIAYGLLSFGVWLQWVYRS